MPDERFAGLPELMASLRSLGSSRRTRHGAREHPRFFAPLLDARRAAARATGPAAAVAAFDAGAIAAAVDATIHAFAIERFPSRPAARRAFEAELADILEPLRATLVRLGELAAGAATAPDTDAEPWRVWLRQLRAAFEIADALWPMLDAALADNSAHQLERRPPR